MDQDILVKKQWFIKSMNGKIDDYYDMKNKKQLGSGQFGSVIEVNQKGSDLRRAVKIIKKSSIENQQMFQNEINIMRELDHPNIIRLYEIYEDQRKIYLVMELCQGGELFDLITTRQKFTEQEARIIFKQVALALSYCHSHGICHRDLKPENLLLYIKDDITSIKVADFGLSCIFKSKNQQEKKQLQGRAGSAYYMSPEVLSGQYNELCDSWSLGVILYILLSGIPPFYGNTDQKIFERIQKKQYSFQFKQFDNVSKEVIDLINQCFQDQNQRPSVKQILDHSWINKDLENLKDFNLNQFKIFAGTTKLKKIALNFIASRLSESEIKDLGNLFKQLDKNNDGVLSVSEISNAIKIFSGKQEQITDLLKQIDTDQNGTIEYTEFVAASIQRQLFLKQEKLYYAFQALDIDGSGSISKQELQKILNEEGNSLNYTEDYWTQLIDGADKDKNGEIDYNEFVEMMGEIYI
ncbi:protein kinase domain protein [Ichthyophthirius multifiliis]|uniref:non-specific serine/threonine protein kinase n=1 Tax=Ichthyophthirius multifiliis TaxID=5932 RepID=G0QVX6_ICHMU|nr:protein kinase domain protein [Ichthyophthirius multifiliis]EGR30641.1 protein kinase domain protein [Ichthyophthirius multifiliis]|eukprot:XP_004032228.1 protein kinase domain protein [Ichthyophthirius multifiliis]